VFSCLAVDLATIHLVPDANGRDALDGQMVADFADLFCTCMKVPANDRPARSWALLAVTAMKNERAYGGNQMQEILAFALETAMLQNTDLMSRTSVVDDFIASLIEIRFHHGQDKSGHNPTRIISLHNYRETLNPGKVHKNCQWVAIHVAKVCMVIKNILRKNFRPSTVYKAFTDKLKHHGNLKYPPYAIGKAAFYDNEKHLWPGELVIEMAAVQAGEPPQRYLMPEREFADNYHLHVECDALFLQQSIFDEMQRKMSGITTVTDSYKTVEVTSSIEEMAGRRYCPYTEVANPDSVLWHHSFRGMDITDFNGISAQPDWDNPAPWLQTRGVDDDMYDAGFDYGVRQAYMPNYIAKVFLPFNDYSNPGQSFVKPDPDALPPCYSINPFAGGFFPRHFRPADSPDDVMFSRSPSPDNHSQGDAGSGSSTPVNDGNLTEQLNSDAEVAAQLNADAEVAELTPPDVVVPKPKNASPRVMMPERANKRRRASKDNHATLTREAVGDLTCHELPLEFDDATNVDQQIELEAAIELEIAEMGFADEDTAAVSQPE
jgi:hypothetical protein